MSEDQTLSDRQLQKTLLKLDHHYHEAKKWRARCVIGWIAAGTFFVAMVWMCVVWPR